MAPSSVVRCFLRHRTAVLLLKQESGTGRWDVPTGRVSSPADDSSVSDDEVVTAARTVVDETADFAGGLQVVRVGEPFTLTAETPTATVYSILFDCESRRDDSPDAETETDWVSPVEILHRPTVPELWTAYRRIGPTVETVESDSQHGSAYLSVRALEVLRDRAAELAETGQTTDADAWSKLAKLATDLLGAKPGMAAVSNRLNRAMAACDDRTAAAVQRSTERVIRNAVAADQRAGTAAAELVDGSTVLTLSRSGTVQSALASADPAAVIVLTSDPGGEGREVAEELLGGAPTTRFEATEPRRDGDNGSGRESASTGEAFHTVAIAPDAAAAHLLATGDIDMVLVGADAILADGRVINKVGTRQVALAASTAAIPVYVVAARAKVSTRTEPSVDTADPSMVYQGDVDLDVRAPLFDVTPPEYVTGVITEDGFRQPDAVASIADEHRSFADWQTHRPTESESSC